jgi:hypothetical protein
MNHARLQTTGSEVITAPSAAQAGPDAQDMFGNAALTGMLGMAGLGAGAAGGFLGGLFDSGEDDGGQGFRDVAEAARTAVDRQLAAEELRGNYNIGEEYNPDKASLSQEEFDATVALYSDIRMGKTNMLFHGGAGEDFKSGAMGDIKEILKTDVGRAMVSDLARNDEGLKVTLGKVDEAERAKCMPLLTGGDGKRRAHSQLDLDGQIELHKALKGGKGLSSWVNYKPGETAETEHDGDITSDTVLFHELTHAYHNMKGTKGKGERPNGLDQEEANTVDGPHGYTENNYRYEKWLYGDMDSDPRSTYGGKEVHDHP